MNKQSEWNRKEGDEEGRKITGLENQGGERK